MTTKTKNATSVTYRFNERSGPGGCVRRSVVVQLRRRFLNERNGGCFLHDEGGGSSGQVEGSNDLVVELHDE